MSLATVRKARSAIAMGACIASAMIGIAALAIILGALLWNGFSSLSLDVFTKMTPPPGASGGLLNAIVGSLIMTVLGVAIGAPLGLLAGTYMAEYGRYSKLTTVVRFINDILLSAPSIVIGLFVYEITVLQMGHFSAYAGALALALLVVPVVVRTTEDMLNLVPGGLREAAIAMGLPRSLIIRHIAYKAARAGLITGLLLAVARVSGETAPLLVHRAEQPVLQLQPQRAHGEPARRDLPVRDVALQGLAIAGLGGRAAHHRRRAHAVHRRAHPRRPENIQIGDRPMNEAYSQDQDATSAEVFGGDASGFIPALPEKMSVRNLDFFYGDNRALKSVNVPLYDRKVTAFIGPSGCGKSTLLRVLNRMYDLYPGQRAVGDVLLDGENVLDPRLDVNALRARVGMVFQKPTPFPMTIYENIAFGVRLYEKLGKADMDERVEKALRGAAIWDEVKDKLNASGLSLSGGQQQRLCIARTVAIQPEVILFDEPCSALDPISTAKIEELFDELREAYTIAIVTHNMQQAVRVSQYTAFMYLGEMVEFGETDQIFQTPRESRTQDYITGRFG